VHRRSGHPTRGATFGTGAANGPRAAEAGRELALARPARRSVFTRPPARAATTGRAGIMREFKVHWIGANGGGADRTIRVLRGPEDWSCDEVQGTRAPARLGNPALSVSPHRGYSTPLHRTHMRRGRGRHERRDCYDGTTGRLDTRARVARGGPVPGAGGLDPVVMHPVMHPRDDDARAPSRAVLLLPGTVLGCRVRGLYDRCKTVAYWGQPEGSGRPPATVSPTSKVDLPFLTVGVWNR
jgi:hypothetical protein